MFLFKVKPNLFSPSRVEEPYLCSFENSAIYLSLSLWSIALSCLTLLGNWEWNHTFVPLEVDRDILIFPLWDWDISHAPLHNGEWIYARTLPGWSNITLRSSPKYFYFFNLILLRSCHAYPSSLGTSYFILLPSANLEWRLANLEEKMLSYSSPLTLFVTSEVRKSVTRSCTWVIYFYLSKKRKKEVEAEANVTHGANPLTPFLSHRNIMEPMELNICFREPGLAPLPPYQTIIEQVMGLKKKMKQLEIISEGIENKYQLLGLSSFADTPPRVMLLHSLDGQVLGCSPSGSGYAPPLTPLLGSCSSALLYSKKKKKMFEYTLGWDSPISPLLGFHSVGQTRYVSWI